MAQALPIYSDNCGCCQPISQSGGGGGSGTCNCPYPLHGVEDPNTNGVVPPFRLDLIWEYDQWIDANAGPAIQIFKWNPNTLTWQ